MPILKKLSVIIPLVMLGLVFLHGCKTVDIEPVVILSADSLQNARISENAGSTRVTATLNGKASKDVTVNLAFSGTATFGLDYSVSGSQIIVPAGSLSGSVQITAIQDNIVEGDESIIVSFASLSEATRLDTTTLTIIISDDDKDSDQDGLPDSDDHCPNNAGPQSNHGCPFGFGLIINELLYDPSNNALDGDANGDGVYSKNEDGFIEFYNTNNFPCYVGGFTISDSVIAQKLKTVRYTIPSGTYIPANKALLVFGGGNPKGSFGGTKILLVGTPEGLSMANSGEMEIVADSTGKRLIVFDTDALSNNPNESYTRNPDITGQFVQHHLVPPAKLFSPGTKVDGSTF